MKIKIGMVQINNSFSGQNYLPLSIGFLTSYAKKYAKNFNEFEFALPIYKRIPVKDAITHLCDCDIVCFSTYVWNFNISCQIAKGLKEIDKNKTVVFGGCHVPDSIDKGLELFVRNHPFIDLVSTGEGERVFTAILENYPTKTWKNVPSLAYIENDKFVTTALAERIENLNDIPSPFLDGYFDELMRVHENENWIGLFETNRGCPFKCTFCDWGTNSKNRMSDYDLEGRIYKEIEWFAKNKIPFVYCCDANFGMYKRDYDIAEYFSKMKKEHFFPERFSVQNTKNSTESSYKIQKVLVDSGLDKGVLLAFQSLHEPTLKAVKRQNIKLSTFFELQKRFTEDGVTTFSDIILGLPLETYETYTDGVSTLIENGQHNRIQFNNLSILPNAPMVEHVGLYGLDIVESRIINIHGSLSETEEVFETQKLVVGSFSMPREKWAKARTFSYLVSLLHFDKLIQIPNVIMNSVYKVSYRDIFNAFMNCSPTEYPTIAKIVDFFYQQALNMQNGGAEFCESKKWLNIWWPADELVLINIANDGSIAEFYKEAKKLLGSFVDNSEILEEAFILNTAMQKLPFQSGDKEIVLKNNVLEIYQQALIGKKITPVHGLYNCVVHRELWSTWTEWAEKVIWWGNKKGNYLYKIS